jgi:uncharacterized damage-inducible protein DinB
MDLLDLMLDHDHWATRQLLDACSGLTEEQLDAEFNVGHRTLRETFGHMIFNIPFWTAFLNGQSTDGVISTDNQPDDRSRSALIEHHEKSYPLFALAARQLRDTGRLGETFTDHWNVRHSFGGTILMVIEHNEGHRFEVQHILHRLGLKNVPEVDLGVWDYKLHNE